MKVLAEILVEGTPKASVLTADGDFVLEGAEMEPIGQKMWALEVEAARGEEFYLIVDVEGVRQASVPFLGEDVPDVELSQATPAVETEAPRAAPKGFKFFKPGSF